jgi:ubiquitin carboxyl-terminal hydrolase 34
MENEKTLIRKTLEQLEDDIHKSWLKDLDKVKEFKTLTNILEEILNSNSIEEYFKNEQTDIDYFIKKFSKETINNILRQHFVYGENGDDVALNVLLIYLKIFLKFLDKAQYIPLWESIKEIFDPSKAFYKATMYGNMRIDPDIRNKKQMSNDAWNESLPRLDETQREVQEGDIMDIYVDNKRVHHINDRKIWIRAKVIKVEKEYIVVKSPDEYGTIAFKKNSFDYAPAGTMTKDYDWRVGLQPGDVIDCYDRGRWYPSTVMNRNEETVGGMLKVEYKIGFRVYPDTFKDWTHYTKFWPDKYLSKDSQGRQFYGDSDGMDEWIPSYSKRIQQLDSMTSQASNYSDLDSFYIDEFIPFEHEGKKNYVIARNNNFSFYYAQLLINFADNEGYEKLIDALKSSVRPNPETVHYIFIIIGYSSVLLHKEYLKRLSAKLQENITKYLNELNEKDLRNMKKETIEIITKVLKYYLSVSLPPNEKNELIEKFSLSISLKMLKTTFLEKRITAIKSIVDTIRAEKGNKEKCNSILKLIEENQIFYEIYGPNSHIQLINKSKELLEIMLQEDKLSTGEIEMIWNATKKGDLEGKLTILKTLKEIAHSFKAKHIKMFLDNIYNSKPEDLIQEEIDLIYELSTHESQEIESLNKCINFFLQGLFLSRNDDSEKTIALINKIFDVTKFNPSFKATVLNICIDNIKKEENTVLSLKIIQKYLSGDIKDDYDLNRLLIEGNNIISLFIDNFTQYRNRVKSIVAKSNSQDVLENLEHGQQIKARLDFTNVLIYHSLWKMDNNNNPIDFLYETLVCDAICERDIQEFFKWIKVILDKSTDHQIEDKIFKLFNERICKDTTSCQQLSIQALESYLKVFLHINSKAGNFNSFKIMKEKYEISPSVDPESLIGFDILWKIVFESFSEEIMNKGIQTLHSLYSNVKLHDIEHENYSEVLLKKCIDMIKETVKDENTNEAKRNKIKKCLLVLKLMIEESEKKGTARVKSHQGLLKRKVLTLRINSFIIKVPDGFIKVYGNTTMWDLKELVSKKIGITIDFFRMCLKNNQEINETDYGKTVLDIGLDDGDEVKIYMNDLDKTIPQVEFARNDEIIPELKAIFNSWYDNLSTDGKMMREDCARFVKSVTSSHGEIGPDDYRVNSLFNAYDPHNQGYIARENFLSFYYDAVLRPDKKAVVWENLRNMGVRNDLKRFDEPYEVYNTDKTSLPRFKLAYNEDFFNTIFNLQDLDDNIAKEAFEFLNIITTNPNIYKQILSTESFDSLLNADNIYKLIYCLQIIESFIEDIEIDSNNVETFTNDEVLLEGNDDSYNKVDWMKSFICKEGFIRLVNILERKLENYNGNLMNTICIQYLLKIIRIFYFSSLGSCDSANSNTQLEGLFQGELGAKILSSLNYKDLSLQLFNLLTNIIAKTNKLPEDYNIIHNSFEMLTGLISYGKEDIEELLTVVKKAEFKSIVLYGLLNENYLLREKFSNALIKLARLCANRRIIINFLFDGSLNLVLDIGSNLSEKNSAELFDYFSYLIEIYISCNEDNNDFDILAFVNKLASAVNDDINGNRQTPLGNEIFIGYLKILTKVLNRNNEARDIISKNYNLIQAIMTRVLFKHSTKELIDQLENLEYINPDVYDDSKSNRNNNQNIRNACYNFLLSMLHGNFDNFEKFFSINLLDSNETQKQDKKAVEIYSRTAPSQSARNEGYVGIRNLGCICYMNSMLQQFFMVPTYRYCLLQTSDNQQPNTNNALNIDDNVFHQLQKMFSYLDLSQREDYVPHGFCYSFKDYEGNPTNVIVQQDAQEFLTRIIDKIEFALKPTPYKYLLQSVFGGKICSQVICEGGCGKVSSRYEDYYSLSLEVNNMKTIYDSLEKLISPEKIDEYNCETCNKKVTITKRNLLSDLPNVLVVHLQRLFYNYEIDRNEKINSRLEFPKVLNLKNFSVEEFARKSAAKKAKCEEGEDMEKTLDTDEAYFKCPEYYEYHLVGVNVHIGSADAGHYFSYINTVRNGTENHWDYDPNDEQHNTSWLKFNDSRISKFNIEKLEEECFGGKMEQNGEDGFNFRSMNDSIQSAYMLIYERRIKSPLKLIVPTPDETNSSNANIVSYKEEETLAIKKEYNLLQYVGKPQYEEMYKSVYSNIFYESSKNEYYIYKPFYNVERLIPKSYYLEIVEDNSQFIKQQNISDEHFMAFFDSVINVLDQTLESMGDEIKDSDKMVYTFMNFIYNILSHKDKHKLLKTAKDKFMHILELSPHSLESVINFYMENYKTLSNCLLNEIPQVMNIHCELFYEILEKAYKADSEMFFRALGYNSHEQPVSKIYEELIKIFDSIISIFPRVPSKLVNRIEPIVTIFKNFSRLNPRCLQYLASKEIIFLFVTFLIGRESPYYHETVIRGDNWDLSRPTPNSYDAIIEIINDIYNDKSIEISEKDRKCLRHPAFLKFIYKNNPKIFTEFLVNLSHNDEEFTIQSCIEITKYIDDITFYDDSEFFKLVNAIFPILAIEDDLQVTRFNIIIGYPQVFVDEPNSRSNMPFFGFNNMSEYTSKVYEMKGLINLRNTCCIIKKMLSLKSRDKAPMDIFLLIMNECITNHALLKYIRNMVVEEAYYEDFIQWGITLVTHYTNKFDNTTYLTMLKGIVEKINKILPDVSNNPDILPGFKGFVGKYLHKDIKKEEIQLIHKSDSLYIIRCDYWTNTIQYSKDLDFTTSRASYSYSPSKVDGSKTLDPEFKGNSQTDDHVIIDMNEKMNNEREWFRRIIASLESGKKVTTYNKYEIEGATKTLIRFIAFNSIFIIIFRFF